MGRAGRIGFELLPQPADEHAQILHLFRLRRTPDFAQQMSVGQYLAGMADEHAEEIELLWRQFDLLTAASDVPAYQIHGQITGCESRLMGRECAECHQINSWKIAGFLHPPPQSQDCAQCHQAPPSHYMMHFEMVSMMVAGQMHAKVEQ